MVTWRQWRLTECSPGLRLICHFAIDGELLVRKTAWNRPNLHHRWGIGAGRPSMVKSWSCDNVSLLGDAVSRAWAMPGFARLRRSWGGPAPHYGMHRHHFVLQNFSPTCPQWLPYRTPSQRAPPLWLRTGTDRCSTCLPPPPERKAGTTPVGPGAYLTG